MDELKPVAPKCICGAQPIPLNLSNVNFQGIVLAIVSCSLCGAVIPAQMMGIEKPKIVVPGGIQ